MLKVIKKNSWYLPAAEKKMTELEHATHITGERKLMYIFHGVGLHVYIRETEVARWCDVI
jgi:hypothetical protein